jgi:hypothetical protein
VRKFAGMVLTTLVLLAASLAVSGSPAMAQGKQLLVADRLSNSVYRYGSDGTFLNTVLADNVNLNQPTGIALSPDSTKLYVSSFQTSKVVQYDYDFAQGTASNPTIFAITGLAAPSAIRFSQDGDTIYVSNLGGTGVAQFHTDGSSAGPSINGPVGDPIAPGVGDIFQFSGLEFAPSGELLVGGFQNFPAGNKGAVAKSDAAIGTISNFIGPSTSLNGASGLLVSGNHLYVSGMFASNIQRFDVSTGAVDPGFLISGLEFPQQLIASPDGNGFLAGILGFADGQGHVAHYDFEGNLVGDGRFADNVSVTGVGFTEATAFTVIAAIIPGDFDNDGAVAAADLAVWQQHYGATGNAPYLLGDADADGDTDGRDFLVWQRQFTPGTATISTHSVPEPASLVTLLLMTASLGIRIRA